MYNLSMKKMIIIFVCALLLFIFPAITNAQSNNSNQQLQIEGVVTKVIENSQVIEETGNKHPYQKLEILATLGKFKGKRIIVENGKFDQTGIVVYQAGDQLVLSVDKNDQGKDTFTITDFVRRTPLLILFSIFVFLAIIIGGRRGASSILGMILTFAVLFFFVLPQVSNGTNPVTAVIIASCVIIPLTFFLSHGVNKKTTSAIVGTLISLFITGILAGVFVTATHLTGFASEEASYLTILKRGSVDIRGLLLAGVIIGLLGVLQDITVSQAAVVYQLKKTNSAIKLYELFKRAMDVGRDHIASMVNTLILVYAGASLPLLLLFINNPLPFSTVVNFEMIAEEIVRTMVASIGLIIAVPITTALTALFVDITSKKD